MNKSTVKKIRLTINGLTIVFVVMLVMSGCASKRNMSSLGSAVIYENDSVTTKAEFPGGKEMFQKYLILNYKNEYKSSNYRPTQTAEGVGIYTFVIDEEGNVKDIKVERKISPICDITMVHLFEKMPKWTPATLDGKPVCARVLFSWNFRDPNGHYDVGPYYPGGTEAMDSHLTGYSEGDAGKVYVSCIINEEGKVIDPKVIDGLSWNADRQAKILVRSMKWTPAYKDGKPVSAKRMLVVHFPRY